MKKAITKYMLLLPLMGLLFAACEDVIEVKVSEENDDLFAVEAKITSASQPTVFLSKAVSVTIDETFQGISGAIVTISDNAQPVNEIVLVEDSDSVGLYTVQASESYMGVPGREYTLNIEIEGTILTGTDYLAPVEPIDSIQIRPSAFGGGEFLAVAIFSQDPPGIGNFYKWDIFINDTLLADAESMSYANDEFVDGNYVDNAEIFIDFYSEQHGISRKIKYMDTVLVHQNSISEFAYNFYYQMQQQSYGGGLFSVPPANVKGNITASNEKVVLGMFTAQDISFSNTVVIDDSIERQLK